MKFAGRGFLSILAVYVKKLRHARRVAWDYRQAYPSQAMSQRVSNSSETLGAESRQGRQSAIMSRGLEIRESFQSEFVVEPIGQHSANSGH